MEKKMLKEMAAARVCKDSFADSLKMKCRISVTDTPRYLMSER